MEGHLRSGEFRYAEAFRRWRAGDETAFEDLAKAIASRIYPIALRALASREAAEEATQEALVRIYMRASQVADPEVFESWALKVALSRINDRFRGVKRFRKAQAGLTELRAAMGSPEALGALEREELAQALSEALGAIDEKHREVFLLREVEGLSHREISKMLGVPEGTVWSRLSYARKMLREHLIERGMTP